MAPKFKGREIAEEEKRVMKDEVKLRFRDTGIKRSGSGTNKLTPLFLPWFEKVGRTLLVSSDETWLFKIRFCKLFG